MTRIVVLDTLPTDVGDMDWSPIEEHGVLTRYKYTAPEERAERTADAHIILTNKVAVDGATIRNAANLKMIGVLATGYDNVDLESAEEAGIVVCNVPGYSTASTAQLAITLLLELAYRTGAHSRSFHDGGWAASGQFSYWKHPLVELAGKRLAIVGLGAIGSRVAAVAEALGMEVIAAQLPGRPIGSGPYPRLPLEEAVSSADAVSIHCPLTERTHHLFDEKLLGAMKPSAFLVNAARGDVVESEAVAAALHSEKLAGYATDVLDHEPPPPDHPLRNAPNCVVTPHIGWATYDARKRLLQITAENIGRFLEGSPQNRVSSRK